MVASADGSVVSGSVCVSSGSGCAGYARVALAPWRSRTSKLGSQVVWCLELIGIGLVSYWNVVVHWCTGTVGWVAAFVRVGVL